MGWFSRTPPPDPTDAVRDLREQALTVDAAALDLKPTPARPHVWGVIMETPILRPSPRWSSSRRARPACTSATAVG